MRTLAVNVQAPDTVSAAVRSAQGKLALSTFIHSYPEAVLLYAKT